MLTVPLATVATISWDRLLASTVWQGVAMANADRMRERASRLLAMALSARDKGQIEYADKLTKQASDVLDEATKAQATAIQPAKDPQPAAQQQQQQQPKKE
jgi:hypothetical protein